MARSLSSANFVLPGEYRKPAERLFPKGGFSRGQKPELKAAMEYAKALGIGVEYQRVLGLEKNSEEIKAFMEYFQNNLDLLIQKTWVDKSDERRKGKLQDKIQPFMSFIEKGEFLKAIEEFAAILDELAYLFFGHQSEKEDFTEYTFRIDVQMGLFWWYGSRLTIINKLTEKSDNHDEKVLWAILLLGLCYLTNF